MKRLLISNLKEGLVLSEAVYVNGNQLLIPKGVVLTKNVISLLQLNNIASVKVEDETITAKIAEPSSYLERVRNSEEFSHFQQKYEKNVSHLSECMNDLVEKNIPFEIDPFLVEIMQLIDNIGQSVNILDYLISMRDYDDSTFCHSINVALLCGLFADWLHLDTEKKETAIVCGLFHDIGKLKVPISIIQKPGSLTTEEFNMIKKHSEFGYQILKQYHIINEKMNRHVKNAALMHHEKCDGTGYPLGIKAPQIDFYAKLVSIVDVYDAMTSARVYREPLCPFTVINHFEDDGLQKYDPEMLLVFLNHVVNTYINHSVKLNDGKVGNIIFINKINLSKPTIKCEDEFVDLTQEHNVFIEKIL